MPHKIRSYLCNYKITKPLKFGLYNKFHKNLFKIPEQYTTVFNFHWNVISVNSNFVVTYHFPCLSYRSYSGGRILSGTIQLFRSMITKSRPFVTTWNWYNVPLWFYCSVIASSVNQQLIYASCLSATTHNPPHSSSSLLPCDLSNV